MEPLACLFREWDYNPASASSCTCGRGCYKFGPLFFGVVTSCTCIRSSIWMFLLVPRERMGTTPPPPVLPSKTGRPFVVPGLGRIGPDQIGSDRSFEFWCRTASGPEKRGTANLLPRGQGCLLTLSHLLEGSAA